MSHWRFQFSLNNFVINFVYIHIYIAVHGIQKLWVGLKIDLQKMESFSPFSPSTTYGIVSRLMWSDGFPSDIYNRKCIKGRHQTVDGVKKYYLSNLDCVGVHNYVCWKPLPPTAGRGQ